MPEQKFEILGEAVGGAHASGGLASSTAGATTRRPAQGWNRDQDADFGHVDWAGYEHRVLWDMLMRSRPAELAPRAEQWAQLAEDIDEVVHRTRNALQPVFESWQGEGAASAANANNALISWGSSAASASHEIGVQLSSWVWALQQAREQMPVPVHHYAELNYEHGTGAKIADGPEGDYMARQLADGHDPSLQEVAAKHEEAVAVMQRYEAQSHVAYTQTPPVPPAPAVVPVVPDPAAAPAVPVHPTLPGVHAPVAVVPTAPDPSAVGGSPAGIASQSAAPAPTGTGSLGGVGGLGGSGLSGGGGSSGGLSGGYSGGAGGSGLVGGVLGGGGTVGAAAGAPGSAGAGGSAVGSSGAGRAGTAGMGGMAPGGRGGSDDVEHHDKFNLGIDWEKDEPTWAPPVIGGSPGA